MSDPKDLRHQYIADRLEVALEGVKPYSPSITAILHDKRVQAELVIFYSAKGPACITFLVDKEDEEGKKHKVNFYAGTPKACPRTR